MLLDLTPLARNLTKTVQSVWHIVFRIKDRNKWRAVTEIE